HPVRLAGLAEALARERAAPAEAAARPEAVVSAGLAARAERAALRGVLMAALTEARATSPNSPSPVGIRTPWPSRPDRTAISGSASTTRTRSVESRRAE